MATLEIWGAFGFRLGWPRQIRASQNFGGGIGRPHMGAISELDDQNIGAETEAGL